MSSKFDYLLKFIIIGDSSVGKSNILSVYNDGQFNEKLQPSIGVEFIAKNIEIEQTKFRLQIWDTDGEEGHQSIIKPYYIGTACVLVIYDITNRNSFDNITNWIEDYKNNLIYNS